MNASAWPTVRPAELDGGASEVGGFGGADRCAIQRCAGAVAGGEGLPERRRDDDADHRHVALQAAKRDAETLAAAHEIGGAVDRIDHPAQAARAGAAAFLALEAVGRDRPAPGVRTAGASTAPSASVSQSCAPFSVADDAPGGGRMRRARAAASVASLTAVSKRSASAVIGSPRA